MRRLLVIAVLVIAAPPPVARSATDWVFGAYVDAAHLESDNEPGNRTWRSKGTTSKLDRIEAGMIRGYVHKEATEESRWGIEISLQAGVDADGLVTSAPPPSYAPVADADELKYLSTTTASYLFPVGDGVLVTGGLLGAYIGWESYYSLDNPNYTRGYLTDYVPYYLWGVQASCPVHAGLEATIVLATGFNYLTRPNHVPVYGLQLWWHAAASLSVVQNVYYGPDQEDTALDFWRFFSDSIVEWRAGRLLLAAVYDFGTERQAWLPGGPRYQWMSGAAWARVDVNRWWRVAVRPEFYRDRDGLMTGARQTIRAVTTTVEYHTGLLAHSALSARIEYRYDRSTGEEGGFFAGTDNLLVPEQNLLILSVVCRLEGRRSR